MVLSAVAVTPSTTPAQASSTNIHAVAVPIPPYDLPAFLTSEVPPPPPPDVTYPCAAALTPAPANGFPKLHFADPWSLFANIKTSALSSFGRIATAKFICILYDHGCVSSEAAYERSKKITFTLQLCTGVDNSMVIVPAPADPVQRMASGLTKRAPFIHVVWNVSEHFRDYCLAHYVFSTPSATLLCLPLGPLIPAWLFGIAGLTVLDLTALRAWLIGIWSRSQLRELLFPIIQRNPTLVGQDPFAYMEHLIASVHLEILPTKVKDIGDAPIVNVYLGPFTRRPDDFLLVKRFLSSLSYNEDPTVGEGYVHPGWSCTGCHANDHPRGLCPFPILPGWNGPPPRDSNTSHVVYQEQTLGPVLVATSDTSGSAARGRNQGRDRDRGRGRGRDRGRGRRMGAGR